VTFGAGCRSGDQRLSRTDHTTPSRSQPRWRSALPALPRYRYAGADPPGHWEASPSPVYGAALLMRFGFAPIRGSNPRASAREQALCRPGKVPVPMSVIITAPVWHSLGTLSDRSASEDAIDRRPANASEPVHPVLAEAGRDGSTHARVPVTGHSDPLNEPLLGILGSHVSHATCPTRDGQRVLSAGLRDARGT
jgi:hypothetical protein